MKKTLLIIGSGRMAMHWSHYMNARGYPVCQWARRSLREFNSIDPQKIPNPQHRLEAIVEEADIVFLAINDDAIENFYQKNKSLFRGKTVVHFSGALDIPELEDLHPLMTFGPSLYDMNTYKSIPLVSSRSGAPLNEFLQTLSNPHYTIDPGQKTLYHALCVTTSNLPVILWQEVAQKSKGLGLAFESFYPLAKRSLENAFNDPNSALTGPIARGDSQTIKKHLQVLSGEALGTIYKSFLKSNPAKEGLIEHS